MDAENEEQEHGREDSVIKSVEDSRSSGTSGNGGGEAHDSASLNKDIDTATIAATSGTEVMGTQAEDSHNNNSHQQHQIPPELVMTPSNDQSVIIKEQVKVSSESSVTTPCQQLQEDVSHVQDDSSGDNSSMRQENLKTPP